MIYLQQELRVRAKKVATAALQIAKYLVESSLSPLKGRGAGEGSQLEAQAVDTQLRFALSEQCQALNPVAISLDYRAGLQGKG